MAGENMSLIKQSWEFMSELAKRTPWGEIQLQPLIDDIAQVAPEFVRFLKNGGRVVVISTERWRKLNDTAIEVNLDAPVMPPFDGAVPEWQPPAGRGCVKVERIGEELFVGGRKVVFHLEPEQIEGTLQGHTLRKRLQAKDTLDPRILDALVEFENGRLIPDSCKQDSQGRTLYLYAWGAGFRDRDGGLYVRGLCWDDGQWRRRCGWLGGGWGVQNPTLFLAS